MASKSTNFYKTPKSSTSLSSRRRAVFFLHGTSTAQCRCLQTAGVVDGPLAGRRGGRGRDDGSLLVAGRLDEVGGRRRRTRLVVTAAVPISSRSLIRRAVRLSSTADVCERRSARPERRLSRSGRRRQRRPDRMMSDEKSLEQTAASSGRRDARKRSRSQERVVDVARRSRKRKSQHSRRGRRRQN